VTDLQSQTCLRSQFVPHREHNVQYKHTGLCTKHVSFLYNFNPELYLATHISIKWREVFRTSPTRNFKKIWSFDNGCTRVITTTFTKPFFPLSQTPKTNTTFRQLPASFLRWRRSLTYLHTNKILSYENSHKSVPWDASWSSRRHAHTHAHMWLS
jgi:hypothetical protein